MKSLVFTELICQLPSTETQAVVDDSIPYETLFLISTSNTWYGDNFLYLKTQTFRSDLVSSDRRCILYQARQYLILGDSLYCCGINSILRRCLTHEEEEITLNECHARACDEHMSGYATA